ncbi:MAG TPA: SpoIIE family protein phosphatase [Miltoncostaeaceae bacterium]|nr:SpoIIE family protein phosphatase [Miltoncostaeaceae bacterium]
MEGGGRRVGADLPRLLAQAPAIIWVLRGPHHVIEFCNEAAVASVGGRSPLQGLPFYDALPELREQGAESVFDLVRRTGLPQVEAERWVRTPDGRGGVRDAAFSYSVTPLRDPGGDVTGVMVHAVEVTDLARARAEAESVRDALVRVERVARSLGAAQTPEEVGGILVEQAREALDAAAGVVYLFAPPHLTLLAASGYPPGSLAGWERIGVDTPAPIPDAVRDRAPVVLETRAQIEAAYTYWRDTETLSDQALVALPVVVGDEVLGGLLFSFHAPRRLREPELTLVGALAGHCALALQRARLIAAQRARTRGDALVARLTHAMDAALGTTERVTRLVESCVDALADLATVRLGSGPPVVLARASGDGVRVTGSGRAAGALDPAEVGAARVRRTGEGLLLPQIDPSSAGEWPAEAGALEDDGALGSLIAVPLAARGQTLGVLALARVAARPPLGAADLALAEEIGRRAGLALDNARLYEEERVARATLDRARQRAERLQRVTAALSRALTEDEVAAVVVTEAMEALEARAGVVAVREGGQGRVLSAVGYPEDVLRTGTTFPLAAGFPLAMVLRDGEEFWFEGREDWMRRFPAPRGDLGAVGIGVPLAIDGRVMGGVAFRFGQDRRPITEGERRMVVTMAEQCAQALERARLYEREHEAAEVLQRRLLPERLPDTGPPLAVRYLPAGQGRSSGDFYDARLSPGGGLALIVGDVVGQGVEAAAVMGQLRSAWRALAGEVDGPAALLARLSRFAGDVPGAAVATAACLQLEPDGTLRHACAGHPPPLVAAHGRARALVEGRGIPLGAGDWRYEEGCERLAPGDLLLVYTDGLYERRGRPVDVALEALRTWLAAHAGDPLESLMDGLVAAFGAGAHDDCALLACRVPPR